MNSFILRCIFPLDNTVRLLVKLDAQYICLFCWDCGTNDFEIDGLTSLEDLLDEAGIEIPEGPYETASGFVMHFLGRIPVKNDVVSVNGWRITVLSMEGKLAGQLLISRNA